GDLGGGLGCERVGGAGDVDLVGLGRVGGAGQQAAYQFDALRVGAGVDGGGAAVEVQVVLGGGPADQRAHVQVAGPWEWVEDPESGEPPGAEPDLAGRPGRADAEVVGCPGAEHDGGIVGGGVVEPDAVRDSGGDGAGQVGAGGVGADAAGLGDGDLAGAVH